MNKESIEKIGKTLKEKRESLGLTIMDVSNVLKINPAYLEAIENGDLERFPAEVFLKGFLKSYAQYLKLDISDFLEKEKIKSKEVSININVKNQSKKINLGYIVLAGIILLLFFSWVRIEYVNKTMKSEIEKRQEKSFKTMTTAKEIALQEQKKNLLAMKDVSNKIIIRTKENCWIEVKDNDVKIFQGLLVSGEEREIGYKSGLKIKLGNAGAVEINVNGKKMANLGNIGEVKEIVVE